MCFSDSSECFKYLAHTMQKNSWHRFAIFFLLIIIHRRVKSLHIHSCDSHNIVYVCKLLSSRVKTK